MMESNLHVPYNRPSIGPEEINAVVKTLRSAWLTSGPQTELFEKEFREYVEVPHALAVNSCTAALHLALVALNVGPGAEVITSPLTFCATVNVILHAGATPVLADVGADGNLDPVSIASKINSRTRAIIPVHLAGLPCDMDAIWSIARANRLYVVEDAAHAAGSRYKGWPIGAGNPSAGFSSQAVAFSFYATKNMTTGEGGMVTTCDEPLAGAMKVLCLHGISADAWNRYSDRGHWYYEVTVPGFKYNLSDIQSALGRVQLARLESFIATRTAYAKMYNESFANTGEIELPPDRPTSRHSWHLYSIRLNLDQLTIDRDQFIRLMQAKGIGTSVHFIPIPLHPFFSGFALRPENHCPKALALYPRLVSLPLYPDMTEDQVRHVAEAAKDIVRRNSKTKLFAMAVAR